MSQLSRLMTELLTLCTRENDKSVILLLAECLGRIGAVDPARLPVTDGSRSRYMTLSNDLLPPWETTFLTTAAFIIEVDNFYVQ